jgi:outer membrane lipoprotein-sorting protein
MAMMKSYLPLIAGSVVFGIAAVQSNFPARLSTHLSKVSSAQVLTMTVTSRVVGGSETEFRVTFAKPNMFKIETDSGFTISDGKEIYSYDKKSNSYTQGESSEAELKAALSNVAFAGWTAFFEKTPGSLIESANVGGKKAIQGKVVTVVDIKAKKGGRDMSLFIDNSTGFAVGYTTSASGKEYIVTAANLKASDEKADASKFAFVAPSGATKAEAAPAAPAATYAEVQKIMNSQCMPCHNAQNRRSDIDLSSYAGITAAVTPGNGATSPIVKTMRASGNRRMPKGRPAVPDEQIKLIEQWINEGAKQ